MRFFNLICFFPVVLLLFINLAHLYMQVFYQVAPFREYLFQQRKSGKKIGFVPTMGALHEGHISLIELSKKENEITVSSIFVNPLQFNDKNDLINYPRFPKEDQHKLEQAGCHAVFCPDEKEMYADKPVVGIHFGYLENIMEGKFRPGHFQGVGVVVAKLLNITQPDTAFFGQKDLQQFVVISKLVRDLSFPVTLRCAPTVREKNGLAMSSRNERLTSMERKEAAVFYKSLLFARENLLNGMKIEELKHKVEEKFQSLEGINLEYFEIADAKTLMPVQDIHQHEQVALCIAGYCGKVRLIDNLFLFS
jgi:pantoate--beta-alanine ligase